MYKIQHVFRDYNLQAESIVHCCGKGYVQCAVV